MRFLLDAQLPRRLSPAFHLLGHEAIHKLDLPQKNRTPDSDIIDYAMAGDYIVMTKDADFVNTFYLRGQPKQLLLVSTGNISNGDLEMLLQRYLTTLADLFAAHNFVELSRTDIFVHV